MTSHNDLMRHLIIENIVTAVLAVQALIALYALGAGVHSLWSLLLLLNLNSFKMKSTRPSDEVDK